MAAKPKRHRRFHPYGHNRCWCKMGKMLGKPTMQERRKPLEGAA